MQLSLRHKKREATRSEPAGNGKTRLRKNEEKRGVVVVTREKSYKINSVLVCGWREEVIALLKVRPKSQEAAENCLLSRCQITPPGNVLCTSSMCEVTEKSSVKDKTNPMTEFYNSLYSHANILHLRTELAHFYAKEDS